MAAKSKTWQTERERQQDATRHGVALRDQIAEEVYYGFNLAIVLADLKADDPETFSAIQAVINRAKVARGA